MALNNPSFGWEKLQETFYRNRELCEFKGHIKGDFSWTLSTTLLTIERSDTLDIYQYNGNHVLSVKLDQLPLEPLKYAFDQHDHEALLIIMPDRIRKYKSWNPVQYVDMSLPEESQDTIWDYKDRTLITRSSQDVYFYDGNGIERIFQNKDDFTLLKKDQWDSNGEKVILLDVNDVFEVNINDKQITKAFSNESWHKVVISPQGFVCITNAKTNDVRIYKDLNFSLMETVLETYPLDTCWCADDTIACILNDGEVRLYSPTSVHISFWMPGSIRAYRTEADGLKVMVLEKCYLISKVQQSTANVFLIGSIEHSAILLDSLNLLSAHAPRAVENLKIINLETAVVECLEAATEELEPYWQKKLLSAVAFGKGSLSTEIFNPRSVVETCDKLRVLNALCDMGMPLTFREFEKLTLDGVLMRLSRLQLFHESAQICEFLRKNDRLPKIFEDWAKLKILTSPDDSDEALLGAIKNLANKLKVQLPMADVGYTAFCEGRYELARNLILLEPLPEVKLPLLLELDDNELALSEGKKQGNSGFLLSVLLLLKKKLTKVQFTKLLTLVMRDNELYNYYSRKDDNFLFDFYRHIDNYASLGQLVWQQGITTRNLAQFLPQIEEFYSRGQNDPVMKEDHNLIVRQLKIIKTQTSLDPSNNPDIVDRSLNETLKELLVQNRNKEVDSYVGKFRISQKKFYHLKCRALAQAGRFEELHKFAMERKSPIGYEPFFRYTIEQKRKKEASVYVSMISGIKYERAIQLYLYCGSFSDAIQLAFKEKDVQQLKSIYQSVPSNEPHLKALVTEALGKL
ncbi:LAMI_0A01442g1_1 [Lachancea mirantina]|uniref:Probable vacuolar protein sorting-associated protein 16 homolog n=1 Tax=Lachancea mirantina TaxID=1230905 RepID=A0A1G4ILP8_9SACH|nr:LAMI_0A01442g1_1 [Lachancea mirantina]